MLVQVMLGKVRLEEVMPG